MSIFEIAQIINDSQFGTSIRESVYVYPLLEALHLIGLAFSVGLILFVDLRLVGIFLRSVPVTEILRPLRPWLLTGFAVTISTGVLLFIADAAKVIHIWIFPFKLLFIFLAGINALWFERRWGHRTSEWEHKPIIPKQVRFAGWTSLMLWSAVVIAGRLIPYLGYK